MKYFIITICVLLAGCSAKSTNHSKNNEEQSSVVNKKDLTILNLTTDPNKMLNLKDIADIEYVPLETNDSILVRWNPNLISEQYIIYCNENGQIITFNRQGKVIHSFNHKGGGPEEYNYINNIVLDEKKEELYIEYAGKISIYSINGKFKRRFVLPKKILPECLTNYDEYYLFCYNSYSLDMPEKYATKEEIKNREKPYFFISKQTGEITPFDYSIPNRIGNRMVEVGDNEIAYNEMYIYPISQNTPDIMITEFADDTIYSLKNGKLLPVMVKQPSTHTINPPMMVGIDLFTDRYIFIYAIKKVKNEGYNTSDIDYRVYDRQSNEFYSFNTNRLPISIPMKSKLACPRNTAIQYINAELLCQAYKANRLEGVLKEIASILKEDDNPVLMLIKFKE